MAVLTEGELLLKEQIELQKGISKTNDEFKQMLSSSKQYQQMLRAINRQLVEQNNLYGDIRETNEKLFDKVLEFSKITKDKRFYDSFNNIYKDISKISDEFRDLNSQLQTGNISLREYDKSFQKIGRVENIINRQRTIFERNRDNLQKDFKLAKDLYTEKFKIYESFGKKTEEQLQNSLNIQLQSRIQHENKISRLEEQLKNTPYTKRFEREDITKKIEEESKLLEKTNSKILETQNKIKNAPKKSELIELRDKKDLLDAQLNESIDILNILDEQSKLTQKITENYVDTKIEISAIDKKIGNIGRTMGVLQEFGLNRIFDFKAVEDAMQSAAREEYLLQQQLNDGYDVTIKKFGVLRAGAKAIGSELMGKFGVVGAVGGGLWLGKQILDLLFQYDERWREISKNQVIVRSDAVGLLNSYQLMSKENERIDLYGMSIRKTAATQKELLDATLQISNALGVNYTIANKQEGDLIANIKERMGLGDDVRQTLLEGSLIANEGFNEYFNKILGVNAINRVNNKFYMNDKALLMDMSKASSSIRLQFRNHSMDLAKIVIDSKKYGANLQQLDSIMGGMMDWEKQLELQTSFFAQTGQLIDTSRLQYYSMYNDIENFQKEFDKLTGTAKEYEGLTRYAQQTKAEMFGMDRDAYAQMLLEKDLMKKINADEMMKKQFDNRQTEIQMKKEFDRLKDMGLSYQKIAEILGDNSQKLITQQKLSDDFGRAIEKIKDTFASFVENEDLEKLIQSMSNLISGTSEFLMEHADLLGIRTFKNVSKKYDTEDDLGIKGLQSALSKFYNNTELQESAKRDLETISNQYLEKYNIERRYSKDFYASVQKSLQETKISSGQVMSLDKFMDVYTKGYVERNKEQVKTEFISKSMNDGMISPRGNIVIKTPEGQIMPNPKDYLIATTNPNSLLSKNPSQNITQYLIDDTKIVSTMEMVRKAVEQSTVEIVKAVSQNRDVNLNGRKVGEMINMSNNRT